MDAVALKYLLDSVILIDHFNGLEAATNFIQANGDVAAISVISRAETLAGFDEVGMASACVLLDLFTTCPIDSQTADLAARLRQSLKLKLPDALQAAVAVEHGLTLVTRNTKDFKRDMQPLDFMVPYMV